VVSIPQHDIVLNKELDEVAICEQLLKSLKDKNYKLASHYLDLLIKEIAVKLPI
jgi:hypothetical protein